MNPRYLKKLLPMASFFLMLGATSCVNDLNVEPIDPSVSQNFNQNQVFSKIYATMALTGQSGPSGNGDVDGIDEGTSGFYRLIWNLNELPTDEALCAWGDPGVPELNFGGWSASHDQITGMYGRLNFDVTLCNHFLEQTEGKTDAETVRQRAETRFIRALNFYYLLDFYGNVPFTEVVSDTPPMQINRADLFKYIEKELTEIEEDMYDVKTAPYGRADKAANWLLKSRLYLNAEVYTGTPRWADAATYAKKVMDSSYKLADAYEHLFMADNDQIGMNTARQEIILPIAADGVRTRSWSTTFFLIASTHTEGMLAWGMSDGWGGNRARASLIKKFFPNGEVPGNADDKDLTTGGDDRAMFFAKDRTVEIDKVSNFNEGWSVAKFSNNTVDPNIKTSDPKFPDTDVPFFRAAEAYLTYAEATLRAGGSQAEALDAVNELRTRANTYPLSSVTIESVLDEKAREFYFEGHRRTDLIRYGYFAGSGSYNWDWKGGSKGGAALDSHYNLYPIPMTDMTANPNLTQNPGY
ncbi:MAG: RagB/SusD family nutrient uptake outer membrane protein [Bacteroidales bacterium]